MIRPPPRSPLFPSPTLFRSNDPEVQRLLDYKTGRQAARLTANAAEFQPAEPAYVKRSEEHTSELQSQSNLVCRLLLEKKKTPISFVLGALFLDKLSGVVLST